MFENNHFRFLGLLEKKIKILLFVCFFESQSVRQPCVSAHSVKIGDATGNFFNDQMDVGVTRVFSARFSPSRSVIRCDEREHTL